MAFNEAKKKDFTEAAAIMSDIQKDQESWRVYMIFKNVNNRLNKLSEKYLTAATPEEAEMYREAMVLAKGLFVEVLEERDDKEREVIFDQIGDLTDYLSEQEEELRKQR